MTTNDSLKITKNNNEDIDIETFYEIAKLGGQVQACHDIFKILEDPDSSPELLKLYFNDVSERFKKLSLKFRMAPASMFDSK